MKTAIISTVVASFVATAASAGTIVAPTPDPVIMPTPAPVMSYWDGFYAGAALGWATGEYTNYGNTPATVTPGDGFSYGGFVGYNFVMDGGFMVGAELAGGRFSLEDAAAVNELNMTLFDAKLRVGFEADRALVYASGGYTMGTGEVVNTSPGSPYSGEGTGWNLGAGVDYLVTDSMFVGAEYVYRDITDSLNATPAWDAQFHTFSVRAGIKF
ncbi:outer membrane protein [Maritimibacter fusiformis]|uniref:Porin family protein n=1 Tax=Maritimibacter fusiformis TaxID=2603819 RepID=A0A5D0RKL6_9RHOB|nr:porin family protein [Maritimibacter fusiformis]TYB82177.1 porin family protein [Maritimibacter fusiformis]